MCGGGIKVTDGRNCGIGSVDLRDGKREYDIEVPFGG